MKGISTKIVTDEEKVRMHTNFAEFENVRVAMAYPDIATFSIENGVVKVHTNTIHGWGVQVYCGIPKSLLKAGQKYGVSLVSSIRGIEYTQIRIQTGNDSHRSSWVKLPEWDGNRLSAVVMLDEANLVDGLAITAFLDQNNADYEISDFRIWEIDDLGGAIVSILLVMLAASLRKEVAA